MSEGFLLLRDFALIMIVAGATSLFFRWLRQPAILGYILAGVIIGPFTPGAAVQNLETIRQLADLGVVLVMFGLGLEFSLNRLRPMGLTALVAGTLEILFMLVVGYQVGLLLGWAPRDALFLGGALSISSTMVIVKVLTEMDRLRQEASRIMVGVLVVQDFAAVAMVALFSGVATTGRADLVGAGIVILKLGLFAITAIGFGSLAVPRIVAMAHRSGSREAVLVTGLALCFALALLSQMLGLSVAAGAFLMGALIAATPRSQDMLGLVAPLRDVFAALFFVAMGMLVDVRLLPALWLPALAFFAFNFLGKVFSLSLGSLLSGYSAKTALRVGVGMVVIGEFSLVIAKVGVDAGAVGELVFPVVVTLTILTTLSSSYLMRLSDPAAEWVDQWLPRPVREYLTYAGLLERAFRLSLGRADTTARQSRHHLTLIFLNILVIAALWGGAALLLHLGESLLASFPLGPHPLSLLVFAGVLAFSLPSVVLIWQHLKELVHIATQGLVDRQSAARFLGRRVVARVLRDGALAFILLAVIIPILPLATRLHREGSLLLFIPPVAAAFLIGYLFWDAIHTVHCRLQDALHRTLLGEGNEPVGDHREADKEGNSSG